MGKTLTTKQSATSMAASKTQKEGAKSVKKVKKSITKDKIKGDLDAMFSTKNKSKVEKPAVKKEEPKKKVVKKEASSGAKKPARFTEEGFKIYSKEDLKIGQGGDTSDCPFDCNCCF